MKDHTKKSTTFILFGIKNIWDILTFCFDVKSLLTESLESIFLILLGVLVGHIGVIAFNYIIKARSNNKISQTSISAEILEGLVAK